MTTAFLLADDDRDDRDLFTQALKNVDPPVAGITVPNGQEALDYLKTNRARVRLIFLDINMPVMNGWQCLTELKQAPRLKSIPVLMYSTSTRQSDIQRSKDLGAHGLLSKPDNFTVLKSTVKILSEIVNKQNPSPLPDTVKPFLHCFAQD